VPKPHPHADGGLPAKSPPLCLLRLCLRLCDFIIYLNKKKVLYYVFITQNQH
jgi:hypothetical protein